MARIIFELAGFFLLPFLSYAAFLIWQERHPRAARAILKARALQIQSLIGLVLVVLALIAFGLADEHRTGGYAPAVFRDGRLIPGRIE
jgi:hypothetical protein